MILAAIIACEIAFWLVLAAGLATRYLLRRRPLSGYLLAGVPVVDLVLLVLTVVDLRHGTPPTPQHGLAAAYLGFSLALGPSTVRWADVRVAHLLGAGPAPAARPRSGTAERMRLEWREFGRAVLAVALTGVFLLGAAALVGEGVDTRPLFGWLGALGTVLVVWFIGWPLWETVRVLVAPARRDDAAAGRRRGVTPARHPGGRGGGSGPAGPAAAGRDPG